MDYKEKFEAALAQKYGGTLGSKNSIYGTVAAAYGSSITSEEQIPALVAGVEPLLKQFQSDSDKIRTLEQKLKADKTTTTTDNGKQDDKGNPTKKEADKDGNADNAESEIAKLIKLVQQQNEVLTKKVESFEAENNAKKAFSDAEIAFLSNDYVKKYGDEATDAWERATELYEATGKTWSAEELGKKAMGYFNKAVGKRGIDTSKPLQSDGGSSEKSKTDFSGEVKMLRDMGIDLPE